MRLFGKACTALALWGGILGALGCSQVRVRETLESAEEKTILRWEPVEEFDPKVECDPGEGLESGRLEVRVLREEHPVYRAKNAVVTRETTTRELKRLPDLIPSNYLVLPLTLPIAVVGYGGMAIFGFPESCYGSNRKLETLELPQAEAQGRDTRWAPAPETRLRCRVNGKDAFSIRTDARGIASVDLVAIARDYPCPESGLTISFRVKKEAAFVLEKVEIGPVDVELLRRSPN